MRFWITAFFNIIIGNYYISTGTALFLISTIYQAVNFLMAQSAFHEHRTEVLWRTNWNHLVWQHKLITAWRKKFVFGAKYYSFSFFNNFAWFQFGVNLYTKKMVGARLACKQSCQIYLRRDESMECTLAHGAWASGKSVHLAVGRSGFDSLAESDQKTLIVRCCVLGKDT